MNMKKLNYILIALLSSCVMTVNAQSADLAESRLADTVSLGYQLSTSTRTGSYSIAGVNSTAIEKSPYIDVAKALYGKIAGLNVYQGTGASPENVSTLSIHGHTPLVLIDGYPRDFSDVTAEEIESIQILTDATATALYGMRGGNGVVLITTKRGKEGRLNVKLGYDFGVNTQFRSPEFADAYTYANAYNQALVSDGLAPAYNSRELEAFRTGLYGYDFPNVDWWNESLNKTGMTHNLKMSFDGGSERFRYYTVIDYYHDRSMLKSNSNPREDGYNSAPNDTRLSVRANLDVDITNTTFMKAGIVGKLQEVRSSYFAKTSSIFNELYRTPSAVFPIRYANGIYGGSSLYKNPVYLLTDNGDYRTMAGTMMADLSLRQKLDVLTEGLGVELSVAFDNLGTMQETTTKNLRYMNSNASITDDGTLVTSPVITGIDDAALGHPESAGSSNGFKSLFMRTDFQAKIDYNRTFDKHTVGAAVIYDMQSVIRNGRDNSTKNQSLMAMVTYNFDGRYTITGVYNRSGSAYLAKGHKFADYPAVSAAWIASNEEFLKNANNLDLLRVRASYGFSGWDGNLSHGLWRRQYGLGANYGSGNGYFFGDALTAVPGGGEGPLPVEGLVAERSQRGTIGIDASAFDNRLNVSVEAFHEKRSNILVENNRVSGILGATPGKVNAGVNRFRGIDLSLSWQHQVGDFGYGVGVTASYLHTKILENGQAYQPYDYLYTAGNAVGQCYGLEAIGFFRDQQDINNSPMQTFSDVRPGDVKYKDQNGDNVIDANDVVKMYSSTIPALYYGFNVNFSYKGFEVSADFQGIAGVTVNLLNSPLYRPFYTSGNTAGTISQTFIDREVYWTADNSNVATMPRLTTMANANNYRNSSLWYRNGSFLKLRNVMLSYTFPKSMTRFADLKIFVCGTNLFSADYLKFADPEQLIAAYPATRSYWVGVKFNF